METHNDITTPQSSASSIIVSTDNDEREDASMENAAPEIENCQRSFRERPPSMASVNRTISGSKGGPLSPVANIERNHDEKISQTIHMDHKRYRIKSSSFNGLTFQQLQMKRIENLAEAQRHKLPRKQRDIKLSRSLQLENFLKRQYIPTPTIASEANSQGKGITQHNALPLVRASTKRELLRLNKRYASSVSDSQAMLLSQNNESGDRTQHFISDPMRLDCHKDNDEASPFKLILCGINSGDSGASHSTPMVTPDGKQSGVVECDLGKEAIDGDYLLHLEQLARETSRLHSSLATEVACEFHDDDSTSSSYDSPTPQLQAASACDSHGGNDEGVCGSEQIQCNPDDADSNYFSCLCKAHVLISEGEKNEPLHAIAKTEHQAETRDRGYEVSPNEGLTRIAVGIKHGIIIVGLVLVFASVEFVKHKISNWYRGMFPCMLVSVSRMGQKLSRWVDTSRLSWTNLSLFEYQCVRGLLFREGYLQNQIKILSRTQYIAAMGWHRLRIVLLQWAKDIDITTTVVETWFRIAKLHFDCQVFFVEIMERVRETGASTRIVWNTTVAIVSSTWRESIVLRPPKSYTNERIVLRGSKSTIPIDFPFNVDFSSVGNVYNQTSTLEPTFQKVAFCSRSTISFMKAHDIPSGSSFHLFRVPRQLNSQLSLGHLLKNHHVYPGSLGSGDFIFHDNDERLVESIIDTADIIGYNSDDVSAYVHGNRRLHKLPKENITFSLQRNRSLPPRQGEPMNSYAASFPTFPNDEEAGEDLFESVNLMDMASEITRRFIPRKKRRQAEDTRTQE
ncbi:hypothetical protein HJC23_000877 [Cyclotella cryptica]|uniref:Uncharacterized protein n=1 Tax=Cyclotella cryptica TaxID=29204 RepID=A0ABD3PT03_9STRA|eukprot:CCRYP_011599-RA/>CCRYP_011599-RA protein AED:0.28 eAED:0.28 QI:0/-1/0/1/-1/1/1/0/793